MTLSRIDCGFFYGGLESASYVAFNPRHRAGSLILAGASAVRDSIGSQVASKLALQHFVEGVQNFYLSNLPEQGGESSQLSLSILEAAFKNANSCVYAFGHKLAAGGRMAASLIGMALEGDVMGAGKVGPGSAYLCRRGEVFPFFEQHDKSEGEGSGSFLGSHALVSVELASVVMEANDKVFIFSLPLDVYQERELASVVLEGEDGRMPPVEGLVGRLFSEPSEAAFVMSVSFGPDAIFLTQKVE